MRGKSSFLVMLMVGIMATAAGAGHYTIAPAKDSSVHSHYDLQDTTMGLAEDVAAWCSYYSGWVMRFYMAFDVSTIPAGEIVDGLTLLLYQSNGCGYSPWLNVHYVADDSWDETLITWNNQPDGGAFQVPPFAVFDVDQYHRGWVPFNLFNKNWDPLFIQNGMLSILVKENENGDAGHAFYSKEYSDPSLHPLLIMHTEGVCEGDLDGDGDVDGADMAVMAADYDRDDCGGGVVCRGDVDGDAAVGVVDLVLYAHGYGRDGCPAPTD